MLYSTIQLGLHINVKRLQQIYNIIGTIPLYRMTEYIKMVSNLFNDVVHVTIYSKIQIILLDSTYDITSKIIYVKIYEHVPLQK